MKHASQGRGEGDPYEPLSHQSQVNQHWARISLLPNYALFSAFSQVSWNVVTRKCPTNWCNWYLSSAHHISRRATQQKNGNGYVRRAHEGRHNRRLLGRQDVPGAPIHAGHLQRELSQHDRCVNKKWADQGGKFGRAMRSIVWLWWVIIAAVLRL